MANNVISNSDLNKRTLSVDDESSFRHTGDKPFFTKEQYDQILTMLNKENTEPHVNMAGITSFMADLDCEE